MRTIVYVDGFNLYYGVLKGSPHKWLNLRQYFEILRNQDEIARVKYFSAILDVEDTGKRIRQESYIRALETEPLVEVILGRFRPRRVRCRVSVCDNRQRAFFRMEEKRTDVNIAVEMLSDAYENRCEQMIVISGDSDLIPAIQAVKRVDHRIKVLVYVPSRRRDGDRAATEIREAADKSAYLPVALLGDAQFPAEIDNGTRETIQKPQEWSVPAETRTGSMSL